MGLRRKGRQAALQLLYATELGHRSIDEASEHFWSTYYADLSDADEVRAFAELLARGVEANMAAIDAQIAEVSTNWRIDRMAVVDRNILRLASYELRYVEDIPAKVTLNEAVEIAKHFGSEGSGAFVNGVLDRISSESGKA